MPFARPFELEPRGVPALAIAFSIVLHGAIMTLGLPSLPGPGRSAPRLIAARNEFALSIPRPAPSPETKGPVDATRAAPRRSEPPEAALPEPALSLPEPGHKPIERAKADAERDLSETRAVPRASSAESPGGVKAARLVEGEARPRYPEACRSGLHRRGGCEGEGAYEVELDGTGRVISAAVAESAGCRALDRAAVRFLLRRARFVPAEIDGLPVAWKGRRKVAFRLEDALGAH